MDWNAKATSWDFSEYAQESVPSIHGVGGSSGFGNHRMKGDFSVDLKLGQVSNQTDQSTDKWKQAGISKMVSPSSGSSKRPRAANNGAQAVSCLVDGCKADLTNCREYHRRHKVCEPHSKTAQVTIGGNKQRFCQQCSRFHSLDEFDEGKRSCRKRLDGHNRRRRKPQPDPLTRSGNFLSSYQGTQLFPFSNSHVYPSTPVGNHSWVGVVNAEAESTLSSQRQQLQLLDKPNLLLGSSSSIYGGGKQFTFMRGHHNPALSSQTSPEASVCQPFPRTIALSESGGVGRNMFCDRLSVQACNSDCALSLLSSPQMQTSGIGMNNVVHPSSSLEQPLGPRLGNHGLEPVDSVLVSSGSEANIHCPAIFHLESDGPQDNEAPQTLPFHWD